MACSLATLPGLAAADMSEDLMVRGSVVGTVNISHTDTELTVNVSGDRLRKVSIDVAASPEALKLNKAGKAKVGHFRHKRHGKSVTVNRAELGDVAYITVFARVKGKGKAWSKVITYDMGMATSAAAVVETTPGKAQFIADTASALEANMYATVEVHRVGGSDGELTVNLATEDGSALAGSDYSERMATVTFADGDADPKVITISISNDCVVENQEDFFVNLSSDNADAVGSPSRIQIIVGDSGDCGNSWGGW